MKPKNRNLCAALSAGALLAGTGTKAEAVTTFQVTLPSAYPAQADYDVLFPAVDDATDLISISSGASVYTGEGGTMKISAIFTGSQVFQIYSGNFGTPFSTQPLSNFTGNNYTDFTRSTVVGLRIDSGATAGQSATLFLPAGTVLTFAVVPEPATALLIVGGLFLVGLYRKGVFRRRADGQ